MSDANLEDFVAGEDIVKALRSASRYKTEAETAKAQVKTLTKRLKFLINKLTFLPTLNAVRSSHLVAPSQEEGQGNCIVCAVLSDTHFDEVVNPDEIKEQRNNRDIGVKRLRKFFEKIVLLSNDYLSGLDYSGCVLFLVEICLVGISTPNSQKPTKTPCSVRFSSGQTNSPLVSGCLPMNLVTCMFRVVGNHGRRTRKPRSKLRARDNPDWFSLRLESHWASDDRVTFNIPDSPDCFVTVHDSTYLLTHGDQARGGGGIGGIWPPIMRLVARKRNNSDFTCMVLGHFHQLVLAPSSGFIMNGSLKGYDEYASVENFPFEPPQQALWINVPEKGILWQTPILVEDRKAEGW